MQTVQTSLPLLRMLSPASPGQTGGKTAESGQPGAELFALHLSRGEAEAPPLPEITSDPGSGQPTGTADTAHADEEGLGEEVSTGALQDMDEPQLALPPFALAPGYAPASGHAAKEEGSERSAKIAIPLDARETLAADADDPVFFGGEKPAGSAVAANGTPLSAPVRIPDSGPSARPATPVAAAAPGQPGRLADGLRGVASDSPLNSPLKPSYSPPGAADDSPANTGNLRAESAGTSAPLPVAAPPASQPSSAPTASYLWPVGESMPAVSEIATEETRAPSDTAQTDGAPRSGTAPPWAQVAPQANARAVPASLPFKATKSPDIAGHLPVSESPDAPQPSIPAVSKPAQGPAFTADPEDSAETVSRSPALTSEIQPKAHHTTAAWPPTATPPGHPGQPGITEDTSRAFGTRIPAARAEDRSGRTATLFSNDQVAQPLGDGVEVTETRDPRRSATFTASVSAGSTTSAIAGTGAATAFEPSAALHPINAEAAPVTTLHVPAGRDITAHHVAPVSRPEMPAQIPTQISHALVSATGPVTELRLSPDELGTVRIELKTEREKVTVTLLAERPETLDLLRRHSDRLVAEFRAAGFSEMNLGFGNLAAGEQGNSRADPGMAGHEAPETDPLTAGISASRLPDIAELRLAPQTSLYLRL